MIHRGPHTVTTTPHRQQARRRTRGTTRVEKRALAHHFVRTSFFVIRKGGNIAIITDPFILGHRSRRRRRSITRRTATGGGGGPGPTIHTVGTMHQGWLHQLRRMLLQRSTTIRRSSWRKRRSMQSTTTVQHAIARRKRRRMRRKRRTVPEGMLLWRMWMPTMRVMLRILMMMRGMRWRRRTQHRHSTVLRRLLSRGRGLKKGWEVPSDTVLHPMIRTR